MRHKIRKILVRFKIYPKCFSPRFMIYVIGKI